MVQKGNPKQISSNLNNLYNKNYYSALGDQSTGCIGIQTKIILEQAGLFDKVIRNSKNISIDSRQLASLLFRKEVELIINWKSLLSFNKYKAHMDLIHIDKKYLKKSKLIIGLLKISKQKEIALKIMKYASSKKGREIFKKYGFSIE
jgi:molybdate transport system substrate-binding protein